MKNLKIIAGVIVVIILAISAGWSYFNKKLSSVGGTDQASEENTDNESGGFWATVFGDNSKEYRDASTGFSFKYPKEYSIKEMPAVAEGEARSLLLLKAGQAPSVQIAVSFFDEDIVLTIDRIKADAPDLIMNSPEVVSVGSLTKGVKFGSDVGTNIWFVAKGSLFQLTAFPADAGVLDKIVSSFKM